MLAVCFGLLTSGSNAHSTLIVNQKTFKNDRDYRFDYIHRSGLENNKTNYW